MSEQPKETELPYFVQRPVDMARITITAPLHHALVVTWGEARILFHPDGRLAVEGCPTMEAAAQAFWRAVQRSAPAGIQVTLPAGYGEET
jgi:hypothetical protein